MAVRPFHIVPGCDRDMRPRTTEIATTAATAGIGVHQGSPRGPTRVKEVSAASPASTARIGTSAVMSAATGGLSRGALRRRAAILAATPNWPLTRFPT